MARHRELGNDLAVVLGGELIGLREGEHHLLTRVRRHLTGLGDVVESRLVVPRQLARPPARRCGDARGRVTYAGWRRHRKIVHTEGGNQQTRSSNSDGTSIGAKS